MRGPTMGRMTCPVCERELGPSAASVDFCSESCQEIWASGRVGAPRARLSREMSTEDFDRFVSAWAAEMRRVESNLPLFTRFETERAPGRRIPRSPLLSMDFYDRSSSPMASKHPVMERCSHRADWTQEIIIPGIDLSSPPSARSAWRSR